MSRVKSISVALQFVRSHCRYSFSYEIASRRSITSLTRHTLPAPCGVPLQSVPNKGHELLDELRTRGFPVLQPPIAGRLNGPDDRESEGFGEVLSVVATGLVCSKHLEARNSRGLKS